MKFLLATLFCFFTSCCFAQQKASSVVSHEIKINLVRIALVEKQSYSILSEKPEQQVRVQSSDKWLVTAKKTREEEFFFKEEDDKAPTTSSIVNCSNTTVYTLTPL